MEYRAKKPRLIKTAFRELMKGVCTAVPGHIIAFDAVTQRAQVQVGIQRVDVNGATFAIDPIIETPVHMAGGAFTLEFQVDNGCEGLIVFSQRCIDDWVVSGGIAGNPLARFHDLTDALFFPGVRSEPGAIKDFANNGIRIRSGDGTQFVWIKNDGSVNVENGAGHIRIGADGTVTINGVTFSPAGLVTAPSDVVAGAAKISLVNHLTSGVTAGEQTSGKPIPS